MRAFYFILGIIFITGVYSGCRKDRFTSDPQARLGFSTDTVHFDTVFVTVGSATRNFKVRNPNKQAVRISNIRLAGGESSNFRINIDGRATTSFPEYELAAGDSFYIFVEVTVDPNQQDLPFIISDSIVFKTNGNTQRVILDAYGQNAHFLNGVSFPPGMYEWPYTPGDKLPFVIYNSILLEKGSSLTIKPGVKVYSHRGSGIIIQGTLNVEGTKEEPVIFQGDRLEPHYKDEAGQWYGIIFHPKSENNHIKHAVIQNAVVGIEVDSLPSNANAKNLTIEKSIIKNMSLAGMVGYTSTIDARNLLVYSCGQNTFVGALGGNYTFTHCTFDNTQSVAVKKEPSIWLTNSNYIIKEQNINLINDLKAEFRNCIIWGGLDDEVKLINDGLGAFDTLFSHNIIKAKEIKYAASNKLNEYPRFINPSGGDYHLDEYSPAIDYGIMHPTPFDVNDDLENNMRMNKPDIGCYEKR